MAKLKKGQDGKSSAEGTLKIVKINKSALNNKIRKFLELSEQTEKLEDELVTRAKCYDSLLAKYENELKPIIIESAKNLYILANNIYDTSKTYKISKEQKIELDDLLKRMLYHSFELITPDSKQNDLFISITGYDYLIEKAEIMSNMVEELKNEISKYFGFDVNFSKIDMNNLNFDDIAKQVIRQMIDPENDLSNIPYKVNKKQFEKMLSKMHSDIKLSIVDDLKENKITRQDSKIILEQAEEAYTTKNLLELLKLDIQYYAKNPDKLNDIHVERIDFYIKMMKDNTEFLNQSIHNLAYSTKYEIISKYIEYKSDSSSFLFDNAKLSALSIKKQMELLLNQFESGLSKDVFFELIEGELSDMLVAFEEDFDIDNEEDWDDEDDWDDEEDWDDEDDDDDIEDEDEDEDDEDDEDEDDEDDDEYDDEDEDDQYSFFDDDIDKKP